jgi:hypothetical protein
MARGSSGPPILAHAAIGGADAPGHDGAEATTGIPIIAKTLYYNPTARRADLSGVLNGGPFFGNVRRT